LLLCNKSFILTDNEDSEIVQQNQWHLLALINDKMNILSAQLTCSENNFIYGFKSICHFQAKPDDVSSVFYMGRLFCNHGCLPLRNFPG